MIDRFSAYPRLQLFLAQVPSEGARVLGDGTVLLGPAPHVGSEAFSVRLFPPAAQSWIEAVANVIGPLPEAYAAFLSISNGLSVGDLELFAAPDPAAGRLLDRLRPAPLRLDLAVQWGAKYRHPGLFFGSAPWSDDENLGYFWTAHGPVGCLGGGRRVREWRDLDGLFEDECQRVHTLFWGGAPSAPAGEQ